MLIDARSPIAWLLLRDGHAVPISGLSPSDLKASRRETHEREDLELGRGGLGAIVSCLGFKGDFGNYMRDHWPALVRLMTDHGLADYRNLFDVGRNDLSFNLMKTRRRALADRIFFGPPIPRRVFLGYGHDWQSWDRNYGVHPPGWRPEDDEFEPYDLEETRQWVYRHRTELQGIHNFFGDQLLDLGRPGAFDATIYDTNEANAAERDRVWSRARKVMNALRWLLDQREDGWIEIIPVTDALVLLKGPEKSYDLLWRNLREGPPPAHDTKAPQPILRPEDMPSSMQREIDFKVWNYHRLDAWNEKEQHEAEKHCYANGGEAGLAYPGLDAVLERYLRDKGVFGEKPKLPRGRKAPDGLVPVTAIGGRSLVVSDMVTLGEYRRFLDETGYMDRRKGESWSAANDDNKETDPVGVTYADALAFCAWKEHSLGVAVRLLTLEEHRALRPFASDHYQGLARQDFPWEDFPPRYGLEPSVNWSEPRFLDPGPDLREFPEENGVSSKSRKRWIAPENWPPRAAWRETLPWVEHAGLRFIDAWDAYEWCADARIAGRFWEGLIGAESWGEYKNLKVGFRLVVEQEARNDPAR